MAGKPKDIRGQKFGRLTVLEDTGKRYQTSVVWKCQCDCGNIYEARSSALTTGNTKSCGCWLREFQKINPTRLKHGHRRKKQSPTYHSWHMMKQRCLNPNNKDSHLYEHVSICDKWMMFENFLADMGERPEGKTLDRIDPYGNYEPSNCRWATPYEQRINQRKCL